jgi:hypothetical protein
MSIANNYVVVTVCYVTVSKDGYIHVAEHTDL